MMEFLKKHYEKIVLCVVLLGLAGAAVWMRTALERIHDSVDTMPAPPPTEGRGRSRPGVQAEVSLAPIDLSTDQISLAQITNPPPILLSGENNLFNPVTWKRKSDGLLLKVVKTGPDALVISNITQLYTIISYDHASGNGSGVYVMAIQQRCDLQHPNHKVDEYAKKDQKTKSGLYIIRDVKGNPDDPDELDLELSGTGQTVAVTKEKPYQWVDSCIAELRYEPDSKTFPKVHVNDPMDLEGEHYKIVEITTNTVRIQFNRTTKVTEIKWK